MFKASTRSLIALSVLAALSGCGQKSGSSGETPAAKDTAAEVKQAHSQMSSRKDLATPTGIAKADGGKTVAEVYAEKDQLAGQKVTVRGQVVKATHLVMGKNWVHVRDGSGGPDTNDLTITTKAELPHIGDVVVVTGTLATNKDFGVGYTYPVLVEDGEVKVEVAAPVRQED